MGGFIPPIAELIKLKYHYRKNKIVVKYMQIFDLGFDLTAVCQWEKTRYGFRHLATLLRDGIEREKNKCCYYNRTWEPWEYHSVLMGLIEKTELLSKEEKEIAKRSLS